MRKEDFDNYTEGHGKVFAIVLDRVRPYKHEIPLTQIEQILDQSLRPPQSYNTLSENGGWAKAVSIATLLHGCLAPTLLDNVPGRRSPLFAGSL